MMRNLILSRLAPEDMAALRPHLTEIVLPARTVLEVAGDMSEHVHFLEVGFASLATLAGRDRIDVGLVGREGMVGLALPLGQHAALHHAVMQVDGSSLRVGAAELRRCLSERPTLAATLLRFVYVAVAQVSQTAMANGRQTVEQRLARWLLMANDRLDGHEIALTHEILAANLGVRRPGVTVALHMLEGVHAIRSRRNVITILDRDKLRAIAGASYGTAEALYDALLGSISLAA